jgi:galactonate dehydratase
MLGACYARNVGAANAPRFRRTGPAGQSAVLKSAAFAGPLAQLVEQRTLNPLVVGSNPTRPTNTAQGRPFGVGPRAFCLQSHPLILAIDAHSARISPRTVWTFVRARDEAGRIGWGEATLNDRANEIHSHVARNAPLWIGKPARPSHDAVTVGDDAAEAAALCAIDQAVWDLAAQAQGVPLAAALGVPRTASLALYANINRGTHDRSPAGFAARAREAAGRGFRAIKVAPFDDVRAEDLRTDAGQRRFDLGVERVLAVREAIGPACDLMVDCHWRLDEHSAGEALARLEPARLFWLECPLPETAETLGALKRLRAQANARGVRLAGCETMTALAGFRSFLDAGAYDAIMPDVKYAGGLAEMLRIGDEARRRSVLCSPHNPTGPIAHLASVHVAALLESCPFLEFQYGESAHFLDLCDRAIPDPNGGASALPGGAGLGAGLDLAKLAALAVDPLPARSPA